MAVMDAAGNKVAERVNDVWRFAVYDAFGRLVADYGGATATDEGGVKFVQQDIRGSTRCVTSVSGSVIARMDYQAFGEQTPSNIGQRTALGYTNADSLRHRYALTENDTATGLDHTWFRKFENRSGRWTSPDPYSGSMSVSDPQSFNRNSYVQNDPVNFTDPSGLFRWIDPNPFGSSYQSDGCYSLYIDGILVASVGNCGGGGVGGVGGGLARKTQPSCTATMFSQDIAPGAGTSPVGVPLNFTAAELNDAALTVFGEISPSLHPRLGDEAHAVASEIFNRSIAILTDSIPPGFDFKATSSSLSNVAAAAAQFAGYKRGKSDYSNFTKDPKRYEFREGGRNCERLKAALNEVRSIANNLNSRDPYFENRAVKQGKFTRRLQPGQDRIGGNDFSVSPM